MSTHIGPVRLIVIRSGKYDFGEIDLTAPVHMVGPNNVGKTSLIALLQLLYVDSQNHMSFSRPLDESKRYYFPGTDSYVLFEVLTPTGFQVVGAHGLGKVRRNDFERFAYQGRFDPDDFLDRDRRVRGDQEVRSRLAPRGYVVLEPKHLRAALTGLGDAKGVHLGLVPLRHRDQYGRFRALFQHLLRLAQIRQAELKSLLLEIYRGSFRQQTIDLGREVKDQLQIIRQSQQDVRELKALQPDVERLLKAVTARDQARAPLGTLWQQLGSAASEREQELSRCRVANDAEEQGILEQERTTNQQLETDAHAHTERLKRTAKVEGTLARLEADRRRFAGFVLEFKEQEREALEQQITELDVRLHAGGQESPAAIDRRLQRCRRDHRELSARLENLAESVGARMIEILPDREACEALFKLIDARLLQLTCSEAGLLIDDEAGLRRWLAQLQERLRGNVFVGCGVRIDLASLPAPDLDEFLDADRITAERDDLEREIRRLEMAAEAVATTEAMRQERDQLQKQRDTLVRELAEFDAHQHDLAGEPAHREELTAGTRELDALSYSMTMARERLRDIETERRHLEASRETVRRGQSELREILATLVAPNADWAPTDASESAENETAAKDLDFTDLASRYLRLHDEQRRHDDRVQDLLRVIDERTYCRYQGTDEASTVKRLGSEIDALPEKESSTDQLWHALAVGLRSSFKKLWQDLDTLKGHVSKLNRQLGAVTVSNLERVQLVIEERPEWGRRIRDMLDFEDMPLFADPAKAEAAVSEIGALLDRHEQVQLADLFGLQFEVTTVNGRTLRYQNLDSVESNGTTITMKVLINVLMLRELLHRDDVHVPYYLDEASSLDHENLAAIVAYSCERGFVPVLASPDPMEAATHLYFVSEHEGRVVLDPDRSRVTLRALNDDDDRVRQTSEARP